MVKTTRRKFIWLINTGIAALFLFVWNKLTLRYIKKIEQKDQILPFNQNQKIAFSENYIVVNKKEKLSVFSSHCTHLGCKINKFENNRFICPCHGSEYSLEGKVLKGPAFKNLNQVQAQISDDKKSIKIIG